MKNGRIQALCDALQQVIPTPNEFSAGSLQG
jgi:ATP phosphoribosyltransferase